MFLADTSVWVDHFRGADSAEARRLDAAFSGAEGICVCGLIVTEILQGVADDASYRRIKRLLDELVYLPMTRDTYIRAADIYRAVRRRGLSIRNTIDCLIAACAVQHNVPLLTKDKDFQTIARTAKLELLRT